MDNDAESAFSSMTGAALQTLIIVDSSCGGGLQFRDSGRELFASRISFRSRGHEA
jgi:hypothetical protein